MSCLSGLQQVYDTPPSNRWQRPGPSSLGDHDIYDTPRSVPPQAASESEVNQKAADQGCHASECLERVKCQKNNCDQRYMY